MDWRFSDPPDVAVISSRAIVFGAARILMVSHDANDGGWQFHGSGPTCAADAVVVSLRNIVELDPTILELVDLPVGWVAIRAAHVDDWTRSEVG